MDGNSLLLGGAAAVGLIALARKFRVGETTHGSSAWLSLPRALVEGLFGRSGLVVGDWQSLLPLTVRYSGSSNILTIGSPGSGKGAGMLTVNAIEHPWMFLFDPGGEITACAIKDWRAKGYQVYVVNPWGLHQDAPWRLPGHRFNPIDHLDPESPTFADDANALAAALVTRTGQEHEPHFLDKAVDAFKALLMHIRIAEPPHRRNLATLRRYLRAGPDEWDGLLAAMEESADEVVAGLGREWSRKQVRGGKELEGIISTMNNAVQWLDSDLVQEAMSASDVRVEDLKGRDADGRPLKGAIIAVPMPIEYMRTHAALVRVIMASVLMVLGRRPLPVRHVQFVVDETAVLGRMDVIEDGVATLRKYRVRMHLVFQSIGQIKRHYGVAWENVVGCCEMRQLMRAQDYETAEYFSMLTGQATVGTRTDNGQGQTSTSTTGRRLLTADEVMRLPDDRQLVFIRNLAPMLAKIVPYYERPSLAGRFHPSPYHPGPPPWRAGARGRMALVAAIMTAAAVLLQPEVLVGKEDYPWTMCRFMTLTGPVLRSYAGRECPEFLIWGREP